MPLRNSASGFGSIAKTLHWLTALMILSLIPIGLYANQLAEGSAAEVAHKLWAFSLHKTLGLATFAVALLRILWAMTQPRPAPLSTGRAGQALLAATVHWLLYGALILVPLSGWIAHAATDGGAPVWGLAGQSLPLVPKSSGVALAFANIHWAATKLLALAILLHIAGALKHHFVDRDLTLRRMLPGTVDPDPLSATPPGKAPVIFATAIWCAVITLGLALAQINRDAEAITAPPPDLPTEWEVQDGAINLTITAFGKPVTGAFADWQAGIHFDETLTTEKLGQVTALISVPTLTLGTLSAQAMGPDFLDAATHPQATFTADILSATDGYEAQGVLRLRGQDMPLILPFSLVIEEDTATLHAMRTLDRRDFGIGANLPDRSVLGFEVKVTIDLVATRATE